MKNQTRHEQLLGAGWDYDAASDRYTAPGSATDGTARLFGLDAAYLALMTDTAPLPPKAPPKADRVRDPRQKEPE